MKHTLVAVELIALMAMTASAQKDAGIITRVIQPAWVQHAQAAPERAGEISSSGATATEKMPIFWNDVLTTGAGGRMRATLEDGSILNIGAQSSLLVRRMDTRAQQSEFELRYGRVRAQVVHLTLPDSKFEVRTNAAIVTVLEGGDVYIEATRPVETFVTCSSGKVDVKGLGISTLELNKHVVLNPGEGTTFSPGGNPEKHVATAEELRRAESQEAPAKSSDAFGTGAFRIGGGVTAPQLIYRVEPKYPEEARKAGLEGTVVLYAVVDPDGMIHNMRIVRSLDPVLDENAMQAARQWKFKPGTKEGKPVPVAASIEITFRVLDHPDVGQKANQGSTGGLGTGAVGSKAGAPAPPETVFLVGDGVVAPELIHRVEPEYTEEARRAGLEGTVTLTVAIEPDGMIRNLRVIRSLDGSLDQKAIQAVTQWKFKPGFKNGKPVTVNARIEISFRLPAKTQ